MLDALIVGFDGLGETVGAIFVWESSDSGYRQVGFALSRDFGYIDNDFSVEDFLLDTLVEVVGDCTYKHTLGKVADFARWNKRVHLRGDGCRFIVAIDGH